VIIASCRCGLNVPNFLCLNMLRSHTPSLRLGHQAHIFKRFPKVEGHRPTRVLGEIDCDSPQSATMEPGVRTSDDQGLKSLVGKIWRHFASTRPYPTVTEMRDLFHVLFLSTCRFPMALFIAGTSHLWRIQEALAMMEERFHNQCRIVPTNKDNPNLSEW